MLSVIIPSYNSEKTIQKCLNSLSGQSYGGKYEIILVDSSVDNTARIVEHNYSFVKLIHLHQKTDPGTARNLGIKEAKGDLIAFIDSDCKADFYWLEKIVKAHDSNYNIVGGTVINGNEDNDIVAWAGYISEFREFIPNTPKKEVPHIPTCNISYKRKIFETYGMFQGEYYPQEDLVFNHELVMSGEKILMDPDIQVYHHHRSNLKDFLNHQKKIGVITARVLKVIDLQGSYIARNPIFAIFLIPLLPIVKFCKTCFIFIKHQPEAIIKRPYVLILFAMGLMSWMFGFAKGTFKKTIE